MGLSREPEPPDQPAFADPHYCAWQPGVQHTGNKAWDAVTAPGHCRSAFFSRLPEVTVLLWF